MIASTVIDEIRDLLDEGRLSQRAIARRLGVSRGTVNAVALGRRTDIALRTPAEDGLPTPAGAAARCPGCGGRVQMPCLLCYMREWKARNGRRAHGPTAT